MPEDNPEQGDRSKTYVAILGITALVAWFGLLWMMFGDVL